MEHENDRLLEMANIEKLTREIDSESFNVDMLRMQIACLTTNGSAGNDESLLDNVLNATGQDSFSAPANEAATVEHDSTDSFKLPSPPTDSPDKDNVCNPVSNVSTDAVDSISSRTSLNSYSSYVWSSANSDLPSWILDDEEERLIWPSENKFFAETDQFEENNHYQLVVEIGSGAFGKCYLAVKVLDDKTAEEGFFCVKECQYRKNELLALELAKKENIAEIIDFYGVKIKGKNATIFMEFMAGGTITGLIQEKKNCSSANWPILSETDSISFLEDVLKAVKFLHNKGIVHRDIKGENVLLDETRLRAKLTDFGSAESFRDASPSIDIWKIACLLLEMLNGKRPPLFINEGSLQRQNSCEPEDYIPSGAMEVTRELLRLCFGLNTTGRNFIPSAAEVLKKSDAFPVTELLNRLSNPT